MAIEAGLQRREEGYGRFRWIESSPFRLFWIDTVPFGIWLHAVCACWFFTFQGCYMQSNKPVYTCLSIILVWISGHQPEPDPSGHIMILYWIAMNHYNIQYTLQTAAVDVTWFIHVTEARQMRGRALYLFQQIHVSWTFWTLGRARNPANPADRITRDVTESGIACWYTTWRHVSIWIVVILKSAIVNTYL
jgi:hypothetical protein